MNHEDVEQQNLIDRYVGESLGEDEKIAFENHILGCPACQDAVTWAQDLRAGLDDASANKAGFESP